MKRFWILFRTELDAWRHDPITAMGGFIPALILLAAFGSLFGGRLTFKIAVINEDAGPTGAILRQTVAEVESPFGAPYYDLIDGTADEIWARYDAHGMDGVWVIPPDFSERLAAGDEPAIEMHFSNYNDDRAKNHRIYSAEVMWRFYEKIGMPASPLALAEEYPRPQMVGWFPIIAVGILLLSIVIGGMMNIFMLTYKEQTGRLTLEFGLAPRSLAWALIPKVLLALLMGLATGTIFAGILAIWPGIWPGRYLPAVWLLSGLVTLFWIALTLLLGLRARHYMIGAIATILTALTLFFIGGGLNFVRGNEEKVLFVTWLFPNIYAVDPLRDLILFGAWPADWARTLAILAGFAAGGLAVGLSLAGRQLRRIG